MLENEIKNIYMVTGKCNIHLLNANNLEFSRSFKRIVHSVHGYRKLEKK